MTTHQDLAMLSAVLPDTAWKRPRLFRVRSRGIEGVPERYRLQFAALAAERLPGFPPADAVDLASKLADRVKPPRRLLAGMPDRHEPLDAWYRDQVPAIEAHLDDLTGVTA